MTKQIMVGGVAVGGGAPVTIQSMCNTKTEDAGATIEQILRLEQAGCEIVRVTVPTPEAAEAVEIIKNSIHIPLVADIHFDYRLAIAAAEHGADKIRINPGNIGGEDRVKAVADWVMSRCWRSMTSRTSASPSKAPTYRSTWRPTGCCTNEWTIRCISV